ncbi:MAG: hypothetical protein R3342_08480 [Lutibacter sp.]|uniref:hypothetical protein n=1 Tax=Lutibacter sp. TaxID=1925666 RepID=UPI00299E7446|nr:hypothetical protein [Lutibacter sp.]MDX1829566.1 hypothetical protein [Lutibacter sp.]
MDYKRLEKELNYRTKLKYVWGRRQTDDFDKLTNFIYKTYSFNLLLEKIEIDFKDETNKEELKNYALNRWFNFWSAKGIETIFCEHQKVKAHKNSFDRYTDFFIENIPFDHKTTVFPKAFNKTVAYAKKHPDELIKWLYKNQSSQQRQHFKNRLFIVLVNTNNADEHWKLKAEISWLKQLISTYLLNFNRSKLITLSLKDKSIFTDIIWAIK